MLVSLHHWLSAPHSHLPLWSASTPSEDHWHWAQSKMILMKAGSKWKAENPKWSWRTARQIFKKWMYYSQLVFTLLHWNFLSAPPHVGPFYILKAKKPNGRQKQRSSLLGAIKITSWLRLWSAATAARKHHSSSFFFLHFPLKTPPHPWQTVSSDDSGASVSSGWAATSQLLAQPSLAARKGCRAAESCRRQQKGKTRLEGR